MKPRDNYLHITDILERLRRYPEPAEVAEIRQNIEDAFSKLQFFEAEHKYIYDNERKPRISVSGLVKRFERDEDWDGIAERYAKKNGLIKEDVQRQWKLNALLSTNNGTQTHLFGEAYNYFFRNVLYKIPSDILAQYEDGYLIPYGPKQQAICKYYNDMFAGFDDERAVIYYPVMVEAKTCSHINDYHTFGTKYAGTFDILHCFKDTDGEWKLVIHDFKTNKSLESEYKRDKGICMLAPFNDMIDEAKSHYTLQLSLYQLNIEQLGYKVAKRGLIWLKDDATYQYVPVQDVTQTLANAL